MINPTIITEIENLLTASDWSFLLDETSSVDNRWERFISLFTSCVDQVAPLKLVRQNSSHGHSGSLCSWYTEDLRTLRNSLSAVNASLRISSTDSLLERRKAIRSLYRKEIRTAKRNANDQLIAGSVNPIRQLWNIVNSGRTTATPHVNPITPDTFNDYFIDIANHLLQNSMISTFDPLSFSVPPIPEMFAFTTINVPDVIMTARDLGRGLSRDIYDLDTRMIVDCIMPISCQLTNLINLTLLEGIFPDCLKSAIVVPIFKKGNKDDPGNYRPISLLPIFSKIVERVMKTQLSGFFHRHCLFNARQFGFLRGKNTQTAISSLIKTVLDGFEDLKFCSTTFFDLSKAFDCVSHSLLTAKLSKYGLDNSAIGLLRSYLTNRHQYVTLDGCLSQKRGVYNGVPQGSILGPLLFLIYINDLPQIDTGLEFHLFADDTAVTFTDTDLTSSINRELLVRERVTDWCAANHLTANLNKTKTMVMSLRDSMCLVNPPTHKFLGVTLDPRLNFRGHVEATSLKITKNLFLLRRLSQMVSPHSLKIVYYGTIYPYMQYAILVWGHTPMAQGRIFGLQKRAIRIIYRLGYRGDCRSSFITNGILTFPSLYILYAVLSAHGTRLNGTTGSDVHQYDTRGKDLLRLDYSRLNVSRNSNNYWSIRFLNCLPIITRLWSIVRLKKTLKDYLCKKCFNSFQEFIENDFLDFL